MEIANLIVSSATIGQKSYCIPWLKERYHEDDEVLTDFQTDVSESSPGGFHSPDVSIGVKISHLSSVGKGE